MIDFLIGCVVIIATCGIYWLSKKLHQKLGFTFTAPVFIASLIIIFILLILNIPYETYMIGGKWINELLGPAVVALAYPLYQQRDMLRKLVAPILAGTFVGGVVGVSTGIVLAKMVGFEEILILSLTPKSVTTPVAMAVTETIGGVTTLAAIFVIIAGVGGVFFSSIVYKTFRINDSIGKGVGMGSASHAIGTAKALENSLLEGSISTIAMIVSAVIVSVITPGLVAILL